MVQLGKIWGYSQYNSLKIYSVRCMAREERSKIKHASFHLRVLEKEQIKSKVKEENNNKAKSVKLK